MKAKLSLLFSLIFTNLSPFFKLPEISYTDDAPFRIDLSKKNIKIVQFTDLHLTYGFDKYDQNTFNLIKNITESENPDLIVFTGDQTLSVRAPYLYKSLIEIVEKLNTPWTFVFGNHDTDFHSYNRILDTINRTEHTNLMFKNGPKLDDGGYGNFSIDLFHDNLRFYSLYFLDSKNELTKRRDTSLTRYEYLSHAQVNWYEEKAFADKASGIRSSIFMHIPLVQYLEAKEDTANIVQGEIGESIYPQSEDTGFFNAVLNAGMSDAVFVGHDHRNNFVYEKDGVKLVYGQNSGFNGYGAVRRGARIITIDETLELDTWVTYGDLYEV